jgi:acetolactate synthase-1/3 small subunit
MIFVVEGDDARVEQVRKQLDKIVEVLKIVDISDNNPVSRELALLKVKATAATRAEIIQIVDIFRANIVDVAPESLMVEVTGDQEKIDSLLDLLRGFGIKEMARTGLIALTRGGAAPLTVIDEKSLRQQKGPSRTETEALPDW